MFMRNEITGILVQENRNLRNGKPTSQHPNSIHEADGVVVEGFVVFNPKLGEMMKDMTSFVDGLKSQTTSLHSFGWKSGDWCFCVDCGHSDESLCDFKGWKWKTTHWYIIGKLLVPLEWYPSCLTLQGVLQKGIYPINTHYIRCIWGWLLRLPCQGYHHFPYEYRTPDAPNVW